MDRRADLFFVDPIVSMAIALGALVSSSCTSSDEPSTVDSGSGTDAGAEADSPPVAPEADSHPLDGADQAADASSDVVTSEDGAVRDSGSLDVAFEPEAGPANVGSSGGAVSDPSGKLTLVFAQNALLGDTHFTFTPVTSLPGLAPNVVVVAGTAFRVDWTGAGFAPSGMLEVRFPAPALASFSRSPEAVVPGPSDPKGAGLVCDGIITENDQGSGADGYYDRFQFTGVCDFTDGGGTSPGPGSATIGEVEAGPAVMHPTITVQPQSQTTWAGGAAVFSVAAIGPGPLSYQWRRNGAIIPGATSSTYTLNGAQPSDSGAKFSVTVGAGLEGVISNGAVLTVAGCADRVLDGDESDIDCGGSCGKCDIGATCKLDLDCGSSHCNTNHHCDPPACPDGGSCDPVLQLGTGRWNTPCARLRSGKVLGWGYGTLGGLGDGASTDRSTPVFMSSIADAVQVDCSASHSCVRNATGDVSCCGDDEYGQFGDGTTMRYSVLVPVAAFAGAAQLAVANGFTCVRQTSGQVLCAGSNNYGQLGDGTTHEQHSPVSVMGLTDAVDLRSGFEHVCAIRQNHRIACWGENFGGQLGDGTTRNQSQPVEIPGLTNVAELRLGGVFSCALHYSGTVACWGKNQYGQLGDGTTTDRSAPVNVVNLDDAISIGLGGFHACARRRSGQVVCWGNNMWGQLGDGTTDEHHAPTPVPGLMGVMEVDGGYGSTCARLGSGQLVCWGYNYYGQLGDGTTMDSSSPVNVLLP
jgi:alpha-tubulin suppressor-like RCC1 family protein